MFTNSKQIHFKWSCAKIIIIKVLFLGPFAHCKFKNCLLTAHNSEIESSDVLLFNPGDWQTWNEWSSQARSLGQMWIFKNMESPFRSQVHGSYAKFSNFFNATMTYHSKSDIVRNISGGYFRERSEQEQLTWFQMHKTNNYSKSGFAAAFISNCQDGSGRRSYINSLKQFIPVNVFGKCGTLQCTKQKKEYCYEMLNKNYKFYLSFENSICQEYVTEKL